MSALGTKQTFVESPSMSAFEGRSDMDQLFIRRGAPVAASNAAQWGTHIRRRNRKCYDAAVAIVHSVAAAICALAIYSLLDSVHRD